MNIENDIKKAAEVVKNGGVILYPTDTIWGIGCDATNASAVERVYQIKKRASSKALIVLVDSCERIDGYVEKMPPVVNEIMGGVHHPLTIIYNGAKNLAHNIIAEDGTVAIRVTNETFSCRLCREIGVPLVSTSANFAGEPSPATFEQISQQIIDLVDYTVFYRRDDTTPAAPSSIIKIIR